MTVNKLHTFGYERIMFVKGEEYLMLVKTTEEEDAKPDDPQALKFDNGLYATLICDWEHAVRLRWMEGG